MVQPRVAIQEERAAHAGIPERLGKREASADMPKPDAGATACTKDYGESPIHRR